MIARERLDADRRSEFRQLLRGARAQLLQTVLITDAEVQGLADHELGALVEDSARGVMADLLARLGGRERHELDEIEAAQARLEMGSFGVCVTCGAAIPLPRLRAMPWARLCLACQAREERRP